VPFPPVLFSYCTLLHHKSQFLTPEIPRFLRNSPFLYIVGYVQQQVNANRSSGVGDVFMPVAGTETFKLSDVIVSSGSKDAQQRDKYMNPNAEYIQHLSSADTSVDGTFTYISEAYLKRAFSDKWADYKAAIGWWNWVSGKNYKTLIQNNDYSLKCSEEDMTFPVGEAFLGYFGGANDLKFTSSGSVNKVPFTITVGSAKAPYFVVAVPRAVEINEITVSSGSKDAQQRDKYMNPNAEYLQVLSPTDTSVTATYTYVSEAYLKRAFTNWETYKGAIGWWNWVSGTNYKTKIQNNDYALKISSLELPAGSTFLGYFGGANDIKINFPSATESAVE